MTQPARAMPSVMSSAARVFDLSLGQMLWSRRSVFLGVLLGGPVVLAIALRIVAVLFVSRFRINGAETAGATVFGLMIWLLYIRFIVPVLGVFYGTSLIADEVTIRRSRTCSRDRSGAAPCSSASTSLTSPARCSSCCPR